MNEDEIVKKVLHTLENQCFADWYGPGGRFDDYLQDGKCLGLTKEDIKKDIKKLFGF